MNVKMWCLMRTKTDKPIKIVVHDGMDDFEIIGFSTRKSLLLAINNEIHAGEQVCRIDFEY